MVRFGRIWWDSEIWWDSMRFGEIQCDMVRFGSKYGHRLAILDNILILKSAD